MLHSPSLLLSLSRSLSRARAVPPKSPEASSDTCAHFLHAVAQYKDTLGWDKFHIIGHSYGGVAGLRMATLAPERILSIIGLCSVMPSGFDGTAAGNINADENMAPSLLAAYVERTQCGLAFRCSGTLLIERAHPTTWSTPL